MAVDWFVRRRMMHRGDQDRTILHFAPYSVGNAGSFGGVRRRCRILRRRAWKRRIVRSWAQERRMLRPGGSVVTGALHRSRPFGAQARDRPGGRSPGARSAGRSRSGRISRAVAVWARGQPSRRGLGVGSVGPSRPGRAVGRAVGVWARGQPRRRGLSARSAGRRPSPGATTEGHTQRSPDDPAATLTAATRPPRRRATASRPVRGHHVRGSRRGSPRGRGRGRRRRPCRRRRR